jgi:hypothetical protein
LPGAGFSATTFGLTSLSGLTGTLDGAAGALLLFHSSYSAYVPGYSFDVFIFDEPDFVGYIIQEIPIVGYRK